MASDNFNRADGTLIVSPWALDSVINGGALIASNVATGNGTKAVAYRTDSASLSSTVTFTQTFDYNNSGPVCCWDGAGSGYMGDHGEYIIIATAGSLDFGSAGTGSVSAAGDISTIERVGNDIVLYVNGVETNRRTDTSFMTGQDGIFVQEALGRFGGFGGSGLDDWVSGGGGGSPSLTDVNTTEIVLDGATGMAVTGTAMGTTNADRAFTLRQTGATSVTQTETGTGTATAATLTISIGTTIKFGATTLRCTLTSGGATGDIAITVNPPSGQLYIDIGTPATSGSDRITSTPDLASGDQVQARGVGGGAVPAGLTLYTDGTFGFTPGNPPTAFDVRVYDNTFTWGAWATQSIAGLVSKRKLLLLGIGR